MSYEHCNKHDVDATNGCPECVDEEFGFEFQTSVDKGREDVRCGICYGEVDHGVVTNTDAQLGVHTDCVLRVYEYLRQRGEIR